VKPDDTPRSPIRSSQAANWLLGVGTDHSIRLPVDAVIEKLCQKGIISLVLEDATREARQGVLNAFKAATRDVNIGRAKQSAKRQIPKDLAALQVRFQRIIEDYDEIVSFLESHKWPKARDQIEETLLDKYADDQETRKKVLEYWRASLEEFIQFEFGLLE
jgi:hypothetical protein